jgi:hypothetical protein
MDVKPLTRRASDPSRNNLESGSKITEASAQQYDKPPLSMIATDEGIWMEVHAGSELSSTGTENPFFAWIARGVDDNAIARSRLDSVDSDNCQIPQAGTNGSIRSQKILFAFGDGAAKDCI